jgi:succinate dehydrogenase / fumarate reductase cytochrome b subunit
MSKKLRPLSPHLSIYKLPLSANLSILHRFTGFALFIGAVLLSWFIIYVIYCIKGDVKSIMDHWFLHSIIWKVMLLGWSFSLFYHLCNGIRHLWWDMGYGFKIKTVDISSWVVLVLAITLTVVSWLFF